MCMLRILFMIAPRLVLIVMILIIFRGPMLWAPVRDVSATRGTRHGLL